jgi:hypothetical protein
MEIETDTRGTITHELRFQSGRDKPLIQYFHREIGSRTARNRMWQRARQSHANACFRINRDLNCRFLKASFVLGFDEREGRNCDEHRAENDVPHYAISHSLAIAS